MTDPYKVLHIAPTASDEEVKRAYRELARKYHPDNYHDNPLADLAQEKMKEINEAYELIQKQRKGGGSSTAQRSSYSYGGGYRASSSADPTMQQVRLAINRGDITQAERLLNAARTRGAEWNFLMGIVCSRRGWMDDAKRYLETACSMEPTNDEYRSALDALSGGGYRPAGYRGFGTMTYGGDSCMRYCAAMALCSLCFPGGYYCLPCYI